MIASLPMYDWPEVSARTDGFYADLRADGLADVLPPTLTRPEDYETHWHDPALVFSQTCWGPLSQGLSMVLAPLAQPDYSDVEGGEGPWYRSAIVARSGHAVAPPRGPGAALPDGLLGGQCLAFNSRGSLSGWISLARDLGAAPDTLAARVLQTGGHRASVVAVAQGRADVAAIDCRSWALAREHEPCAHDLVVIGWTAQRPGLPYVTHKATDPAIARRLQETLIKRGAHPVPQGVRI